MFSESFYMFASYFFLSKQDDEDGHFVVLNILEEIMLKTGTEFLDSFARLGVFSKVQALMDDETEAESSVIKSPTDFEVATAPSAATSQPSTSSSPSTAEESTTKGKFLKWNTILSVFECK